VRGDHHADSGFCVMSSSQLAPAANKREPPVPLQRIATAIDEARTRHRFAWSDSRNQRWQRHAAPRIA
jgi:hypothetical protein